MNDACLVRSVLVESMRVCSKSRAQIADEMSYLTGTPITERMLNGFAAESREDHKFPAELDRAFCFVVGDDRLLTCRAEAFGLHVIDDTGWELLELGREYLRQKRSASAVASLEKHLAGVEL
jgi:hypothetical protein